MSKHIVTYTARGELASFRATEYNLEGYGRSTVRGVKYGYECEGSVRMGERLW